VTTAAQYSATHGYPIEAELLAYAKSSESGVSRAGRTREVAALRALGYRDASLGRIYEGHLDGGQLVGRYGTPAQRAAAERDVDMGRLFGVWNTQDADGVTIASAGDGYVLRGSKTWASGASAVTRAVVTATYADGGVQMCLVPLERVATVIDTSAWQPLGMHASQSFRVSFDGVRLDANDLIGSPNDYERQPCFSAARYVSLPCRPAFASACSPRRSTTCTCGGATKIRTSSDASPICGSPWNRLCVGSMPVARRGKPLTATHRTRAPRT